MPQDTLIRCTTLNPSFCHQSSRIQRGGGGRRVINPDVEFFLIDRSRSAGEDRRFYAGYTVVSGAHEVVQAEPLPPHRSAQEVK
ncbi:hypothetical protein GDO81_022679 [Engystomops pustulosus]|uniref:Uncharacterized protein n=1 Tax=Engystomops pustulosus TaxID=76066 RepID=A0AAV6YQT1_ENGPU|nr:hypothetical protein GDO81_022679 [Engystomops pustulosus]